MMLESNLSKTAGEYTVHKKNALDEEGEKMGVRGYKWQGEYSREYCTNLEINGSPEVPPAGAGGSRIGSKKIKGSYKERRSYQVHILLTCVATERRHLDVLG
jgi:hypothetical protein